MNDFMTLAKERTPEMIDFCKKIIGTKSNSGQESEVAKLFTAEMERLGYDEVFTDDWGNVVGLVKGTQPGPVIMFNGHMDAVDEGDITAWEPYDPFGAQIDEAEMENPLSGGVEMTQVMHGRGTSDMKCGLAAMVYAGGVLADMKRAGRDFAGTFLLTAVVLEENGEMMGTIKLCEGILPEKGIEPDAMICGEPSGLKMSLGHRGRMEIRVEVKGISCHGSSPWLGVNAVEQSAELIRRVRLMMEEKKEDDPYLGKPGMALTMYRCEPNELCIVPNKAVIVYDRRLVPGETTAGAVKEIQDIVEELRAEDPTFDAEVTVNRNMRSAYTGKAEEIESSKDVWIIDREHPFVKACSSALEEIGEPVVYDYWPFSTDIPQLATIMKKPAIGYGAGQGYVVHTPHEKIRLDFLERSLAGYIAMYLKASQCDASALTAE